MNWKLPDWRALEPRQRYLIGGAATGTLGAALLLTLWAAGVFGGGSDDESLVECPPCPSGSPTQTPFSVTARAVTPTPCCTPTTAPTVAPTEVPITPAPVTPAPVTPPPAPPTYGLAPFMSGGSFNLIVDFAIIPGTNGTEAVVVTQKDARLLRVSLTGTFAPTVYGDLSGFVGGGGTEEGLLSATFSPDFVNDRRIYVYYTQGGSAGRPTVLSRFNVPGDSIDTGSERRILEFPDFASNHNGGRVLFGPDGYLYLSLGDGGGGGDPQENGQNLDTLLGKVLRLKVTGEDRYSVPPDNPFVGTGGLDEIWAYGFRNPWRYSFDRATASLWLGDVGQGSFEEVDLVIRGGNYGWDCFEGFAEFEGGCGTEGFQPPRAVYSLAGEECAVTGGYVYRGSALPELVGNYIYADFCSGLIWALYTENPSAQPVVIIDSGQQISSFAELPDGELLVLTFSNTIFRLSR
jgi:glucose/arabinose dehydrogenase